MISTRRIAYVSFDIVPAPKGASTHIQAFAQSLADAFGGIELVTIAPGVEPTGRIERWPGVFHTELPALGASLIDRVLCFRRFLAHWLDARQLDAIQFRSIFEGMPLLDRKRSTRPIFEVNGLPSIELKYRYPGVEDDRELMGKLLSQEQACLSAADAIVTPSSVTKSYLTNHRRVDGNKIWVIPNGVDLATWSAPAAVPTALMRFVYFGTLSSWQGVDLAIRALGQVRAHIPATLTIIGTGSSREKDSQESLAAKLGIAQSVEMLAAKPQAELAAHVRASDAVLAPLTLNDRNVLQGCCPLKVLEGMAAGLPVIASDLPVVRELGEAGVHFFLVKPGSVDQIAQAMLQLAADRALAARIGQQARTHVETNYTWNRAGGRLISVYEELGISRARIA